MDKSLALLCDAVNKIISQLKPQLHPVSFILLIGKPQQGKTALLRQGQLEHVLVQSDYPCEIYYNQHGLIVELSETWLTHNKNLLQYTLKQLNRCHRAVKISGLMLCVEVPELFSTDPDELSTKMKAHAQLLERFATNLGYPIDVALMFCKLDVLAGFCDFFQYEHASDLQKPFGFSLQATALRQKLTDAYKIKFEQFIEAISHQVLNKIHPARSSIKRTLIREFPLQLSSLRTPIHWLINNISPRLIRLQALYFTSAEQGGVSLDRLTKKIEREYALTIQDQFPQSHNYRAYFIEGALLAFQAQTKQQHEHMPNKQRQLLTAVAGVGIISLSLLAYQYLRATQLLDEASKELIAYDTLNNQQHKPAAATYHLTKAAAALDNIAANKVSLPTLHQLKKQLHWQAREHLNSQVLPTLLAELEHTINNAQQSHTARYEALKIYLMLGQPEHFSQAQVLAWFRQHWQKQTQHTDEPRKLALLKHVIQRKPFKALPIQTQVITDARNFLNALPASYLYYSLAKTHFPTHTQNIELAGFAQQTLQVPDYLTKTGFSANISKLNQIVTILQAENWVLARQDLHDLPLLLQQAYCYEYVIWWQNLMRQLKLTPARDYTQTHGLLVTLREANSFKHFINFIQQQVSPLQEDTTGLFNREIASKFTELSLLSHSAIEHLLLTLNELEKFTSTLAIVNDQGKTAFNLTKSRFQNDIQTNPLSALYQHTRQLPEPISHWAKQIADDTWFSLINDSRSYINHQWRQLVLQDYQHNIANRYPFDANQSQDIALTDFEHFFAPNGTLNRFVEEYIKPFLDTSNPQWQLKQADNYVVPISSDMINEFIRANVITNMFFLEHKDTCQIDFSLQKLSLDPIVASLRLVLGENKLVDTQGSESYTEFHWPVMNARLILNSIEGKRFELEESGPWAFFRMLQKVNVLVDEQDSANLEIMFEINGNSGRYLLKTQNQVNPFIPGVLHGFNLTESIV